MQPLDKAFVGHPKISYCQKKLKMTLFKPMASRHRLPNWQTVRKIQEAATGATASNGCRATGLLPCDKNTFRALDFHLASGNIDAAPVNLPAISHHSVLLIFRRSLLLRLSDHQLSAHQA
jgi:hypothetical protein